MGSTPYDGIRKIFRDGFVPYKIFDEFPFLPSLFKENENNPLIMIVKTHIAETGTKFIDDFIYLMQKC